MSILFPTMEKILEYKVKPTEGEWTLLKFSNDNPDDTYEVYFQPFINGDMPDIIVIREIFGVLIIEVKDWNWGSYRIENLSNPKLDAKWFLKSNDVEILSPIKQVKNYKDNFYKLQIENQSPTIKFVEFFFEKKSILTS